MAPIQENTPETHQWLRDYGAFLAAEYPEALTIGEIFGAGASMLEPYYEPEQLHRYFQFEIAGQLVIAANLGSGGGLISTIEDALARQPDATFRDVPDQSRPNREV